MARTVDLDALRRRPWQSAGRGISAPPPSPWAGWNAGGRGKGSHIVLQRNGRTLVIPVHPNKHTYRSVLNDMERWS